VRDGDRVTAIKAINVRTGQSVAWLTLLMVIVTFIIVVLRYVFGTGLIWLQESLTWMHAVVFMMGAAYTLGEDQHVRVDVFYRDMTESRRAWVNLLGVLFFVLPVCGLLFFESFGYVVDSWSGREVSRNSGGLPYPAVPLLKSVLLLMPLAVVLQGFAMVARSLQQIRRS
jgi:TRAP-type mannitol/chloroaromatic compound transport system permease small subunit